MTFDAARSAASGTRELLLRHGWVLRRRGAGTRSRFVLSRAGERRGFCEFFSRTPRGGGDSLTPAVRLRAVLRPGAVMKAPETEGIAALRAQLALMLELLRRGAGERPRATSLVERHEGRQGPDLLLRTTFACNQRCAFCFVPLTGRRADLAAIERELDAHEREARRGGQLILSGGEPAADPRLPRIIAAARLRGFRRFTLQTNGVHLAREGLLEELISLGVTSYMVSLHSHEARTYDRITRSRGQFGRAAAGLARVLARPDCLVTVNVVVNARNYRQLPALADFISGLRAGRRRGPRHSVYFSMINEAGQQKAPSWTVSLEAAAPYLRRAVARCREAGLCVSRSGGESAFPVCLLDAPVRHAAQRPMPQDRVRYAEDFSGEAGGVGRAKRPSCRACPYDSRCAGVPAGYARRYGLGALRPRRQA